MTDRLRAPQERQPEHAEQHGDRRRRRCRAAPSARRSPVRPRASRPRRGSRRRSCRRSRSGARSRRPRPRSRGSRRLSVSAASRLSSSYLLVKFAKASLTMTCLTATASGPSLRTVSSMMPGVERDLVDRRAPRPAGRAARRGRARRAAAKSTTIPAISASGIEPEQPQPGAARLRRAAGLGGHQSSTSKKPIQPELGELGLVGVEHVLARVREAQLEDPALPLHLADRVRELRRLERRPRREVVEEVRVEVERVDRVVLEDVDEVDPDELVALHLDRAVEVVEARRC